MESDLGAFILHRMEIVQLYSLCRLSGRSGLSKDLLAELIDKATIDVLDNYSSRRALAWALRVSLRQLYSIEAGGEWVPDDDYYDADTDARPKPGSDGSNANAVDPAERGTPAIGWASFTGPVDLDENWSLLWGKRLPVRYGSGRMIFGLELQWESIWRAFRTIPLFEAPFNTNVAAFISDGFSGGNGYYCRMHQAGGRTRLVFPNGDSKDVDSEMVVCVARPVGRWPQDPDRPDSGIAIEKATGQPGELVFMLDEFSQEHPNYESA